jgi:hypothetical protein
VQPLRPACLSDTNQNQIDQPTRSVESPVSEFSESKWRSNFDGRTWYFVLKFVLFLVFWLQPDWLIWLPDADDAERSVVEMILSLSPTGLNSSTTNWSWRWRHCFPPKT